MADKNLTILVVSIDAAGHFNACIGIAEGLRDRGHTVVFAVPESWKNKLVPMGFVEEWYEPTSTEMDEDPSKKLKSYADLAAQMGKTFQLPPEEQIEFSQATIFKKTVQETMDREPRLKEIIAKIKPDLIIADLMVQQPAIMNSGIPWILSISFGPLPISTKNVPPPSFGFATVPTEQDKLEWEKVKQTCAKFFGPTLEDFQRWLTSNGGPELKHFSVFTLNYSPYANIYMSPEELDYTEFRPNPPNFYRFDTFMRNSTERFEIPESIVNKSGKLVYFSMGTIASAELGMMRRLIKVLGKSPHRFIVSKGPLGEQLQLPDNMWGADFVPQLAVIPLVDLVITHGGNNTITDTFYFGKPVLLFPLFGDQMDIAQRVAETGFGLRLHPYHSPEQEILEAIEKLLKDKGLSQRLSKISERIQNSNNRARITELIENVALRHEIIREG